MRYKKRLSLVLLPLILSSCSQTQIKVDEENDYNSPSVRKTSLSSALSCASNRLEHANLTGGFIFSISDIPDGTVKSSVAVDGPLSDEERIELIDSLLGMVDMSRGVVLTKNPPIFSMAFTENNKESGYTRYGTVDGGTLNSMANDYLSVANAVRKSNKLPPLKSLNVLAIDGAFTRNDLEPAYKKSNGFNGGVSGQEPTGNIDFGQSGKTKGVSLVVTISNPLFNQVIASRSFTAYSLEKDNTFKISFGYKGGYLGYSYEDIIVQPTHGIQQALIDAAALWIVDETYGDTHKEMNLHSCLKPEAGKLIRENHS
ncbi:hypothetical protein BCS42_04195 [Crenothrix sp. D3]|jgi:hypothetical protein|nr:hypothetical protein BCS42_04195 [Crenothrix sp. D3]